MKGAKLYFFLSTKLKMPWQLKYFSITSILPEPYLLFLVFLHFLLSSVELLLTQRQRGRGASLEWGDHCWCWGESGSCPEWSSWRGSHKPGGWNGWVYYWHYNRDCKILHYEHLHLILWKTSWFANLLQ